MIDTPLEENIQDSETNQGQNTEVVKYDKSKKYSDWLDKTLINYKDKDKIEDEKGIIRMFAKKIDVDNAIEVNGGCEIISTF